MTQFVHCRGCGQQIHETAPTCPKCGAPQMVSQTSSPPPLAATQGSDNTQNSGVVLTDKWREVFALIDKAGGAELPHENVLTKDERKRVRINGWAALFTWLYYMLKGMWKKGLVYLAITLVSVIVLETVLGAFFGGSLRGQAMASKLSQLIVFIGMVFLVSPRANTDYYKKVKSGWNEWW